MVSFPLPLLLLTLTSVPLGGKSTCPRPTEVERQLRLLLPEVPARSRHAVLSRTPKLLQITLFEGEVKLGERSLRVQGSCQQLAQTAAVVLASWLSELDAAVEPPPSPPPPELVEEPVSPRTQEPAAAPPWRMGFAAGIALSISEGAPATGGLFSVQSTHVASGWGATTSVSFRGRHLRLASGSAEAELRREWEIYAWDVGVLRTFTLGGFRVDAEACLAGAVLGQRMGDPELFVSTVNPLLGTTLTVRLTAPSGIWFAGQLAVWPTAARLLIPWAEGVLAAGLSWSTP